MAEELNAQERRELERWRSGSLRKSWPKVESVPDGLRYAAELVRSQGTEGGDEHDELLRQAAIRLRDMNDAARVLVADRDLLLWLHAEAAWQRDAGYQMLERLETQHVDFIGPDGNRIHPDWCRECRVQPLKDAIADIDAHATPVGLLHNDDPEGSPHHYMLTVGALHRALGKAYTAEPCESERERLRIANRDQAAIIEDYQQSIVEQGAELAQAEASLDHVAEWVQDMVEAYAGRRPESLAARVGLAWRTAATRGLAACRSDVPLGSV